MYRNVEELLGEALETLAQLRTRTPVLLRTGPTRVPRGPPRRPVIVASGPTLAAVRPRRTRARVLARSQALPVGNEQLALVPFGNRSIVPYRRRPARRQANDTLAIRQRPARATSNTTLARRNNNNALALGARDAGIPQIEELATILGAGPGSNRPRRKGARAARATQRAAKRHSNEIARIGEIATAGGFALGTVNALTDGLGNAVANFPGINAGNPVGSSLHLGDITTSTTAPDEITANALYDLFSQIY